MAILAHHARGPLISSLVVRIITFPGLLTSYSPVAWSNLLSTLRYVDTWTLHHGSLNYISRSLLVLICIVVSPSPRFPDYPRRLSTRQTLYPGLQILPISYTIGICGEVYVSHSRPTSFTWLSTLPCAVTLHESELTLSTHHSWRRFCHLGDTDFFVMFEYVSSFSSRSLAANLIVCTCTQPTC